MILWLDNQWPPALASWMRATVDVECRPIRELNLQRASDLDIFLAARAAGAVVVTKDADFAALGEQPTGAVLVHHPFPFTATLGGRSIVSHCGRACRHSDHPSDMTGF